MREKPTCPVCKRTKLILRQINLECAVYLCRDKNCAYPAGHQWIFVERTLEEMHQDKTKKPKRKPPKCKTPTPADEFDLNDLIESEINKIQNAEGNPNSGDFFNDGEFDFSGLLNDAYVENVLGDESMVSKEAVGFCDNFDSSRLSELLDSAGDVNNARSVLTSPRGEFDGTEDINNVRPLLTSPRGESDCGLEHIIFDASTPIKLKAFINNERFNGDSKLCKNADLQLNDNTESRLNNNADSKMSNNIDFKLNHNTNSELNNKTNSELSNETDFKLHDATESKLSDNIKSQLNNKTDSMLIKNMDFKLNDITNSELNNKTDSELSNKTNFKLHDATNKLNNKTDSKSIKSTGFMLNDNENSKLNNSGLINLNDNKDPKLNNETDLKLSNCELNSELNINQGLKSSNNTGLKLSGALNTGNLKSCVGAGSEKTADFAGNTKSGLSKDVKTSYLKPCVVIRIENVKSSFSKRCVATKNEDVNASCLKPCVAIEKSKSCADAGNEMTVASMGFTGNPDSSLKLSKDSNARDLITCVATKNNDVNSSHLKTCVATRNEATNPSYLKSCVATINEDINPSCLKPYAETKNNDTNPDYSKPCVATKNNNTNPSYPKSCAVAKNNNTNPSYSKRAVTTENIDAMKTLNNSNEAIAGLINETSSSLKTNDPECSFGEMKGKLNDRLKQIVAAEKPQVNLRTYGLKNGKLVQRINRVKLRSNAGSKKIILLGNLKCTEGIKLNNRNCKSTEGNINRRSTKSTEKITLINSNSKNTELINRNSDSAEEYEVINRISKSAEVKKIFNRNPKRTEEDELNNRGSITNILNGIKGTKNNENKVIVLNHYIFNKQF